MRVTRRDLRRAEEARKRAWRLVEDLAEYGRDTTRAQAAYSEALAKESALKNK